MTRALTFLAAGGWAVLTVLLSRLSTPGHYPGCRRSMTLTTLAWVAGCGTAYYLIQGWRA